MKRLHDWLRRAGGLLAAPEPDMHRHAARVFRIERDLVLPIKAALIFGISWFLFFSLSIEALSNTSEVALEAVNTVQRFFVLYAVANLGLGLGLAFGGRRLPVKLLEWLVFTNALLDGLFLAALTLVTDGFDSILYWLFPVLIVRNALSMPVAALQGALQLVVIGAYAAAGVLDVAIIRLDDPAAAPPVTEPFLLRIFVLLLLAFCCYGVNALAERERRRRLETQEFALRQEQFAAAGRLAAEIAHQIKNPLAVISSAAFNLQRALGPAVNGAARELEIIRAEVERSDRIVTELMGAAQLTEGRVERLDVAAELEAAVARIFPPAAGYATEIARDYAPGLPGLLLPRRQLGLIFDNLLQNAREALGGRGRLRLGAAWHEDHGVEVTVADDGPGIPPELQDRVFEAYYTTKPRGSGLGLAIVKQNVELYGGRVTLDSAAGRGTTFRLWFPARTALRLHPA